MPGVCGCGTADTDSDGDGLADCNDECSNTPAGTIVDAVGCSVNDYCPAGDDWKNHGAYVSCVSRTAEDFVDSGIITEAEKDAIVSEAAQSNIGKNKKKKGEK